MRAERIFLGIALLLGTAVGCSRDSEPASPLAGSADESLNIDIGLSRLGGSPDQPGFSASRLVTLPKWYLDARNGARSALSPGQSRPPFSPGAAVRYSIASGTGFATTPALMGINGVQRLMVVTAAGEARSYSDPTGTVALCNSSTSTIAPISGTAIAVAPTGNKFYYVSESGQVVCTDSDSCSSDGISCSTYLEDNMGRTFGTYSMPWVERNGYVYSLAQVGSNTDLFYSDAGAPANDAIGVNSNFYANQIASSSPVVWNHALYFGTAEGRLYRVNIGTGAPPDAGIFDYYNLNTSAAVQTPFIVEEKLFVNSGGRVLVYAVNPSGSLTFLDISNQYAASGNETAVMIQPGATYGVFAARDHTIYASTFDPAAENGSRFASFTPHATNAAGGEQYDAMNWPMLYDNKLFIGTNAGHLYGSSTDFGSNTVTQAEIVNPGVKVIGGTITDGSYLYYATDHSLERRGLFLNQAEADNDTDCLSGIRNGSGFCLGNTRDPCTQGSDCKSGTCPGNLCQGDTGDPCWDADDCEVSNSSCTSNICTDPG